MNGEAIAAEAVAGPGAPMMDPAPDVGGVAEERLARAAAERRFADAGSDGWIVRARRP